MKRPRQDPPSTDERNARLKAALKANIARRKVQASARQSMQDDPPAPASRAVRTMDDDEADER